MSENSPLVTPEVSSSEEAPDNPKNKKKKKALGTFLVEAEPTGKSGNFWGKDKSPESSNSDKKKPTAESDTKSSAETKTDVSESLAPEEISQVTSKLASARQEQIQAGSNDEPESPELLAAQAYLAAVEAEGDIEAAYQTSLEQIEESEPIEESENDHVIVTNTPSEGEISLHQFTSSLETSETPPSTQTGSGNGTGGSGRPPQPPSFPPPAAAGSFGFNNLPPAGVNSTSEAAVPLADSLRRERNAQSEGLVVGAVVGYLMGRRRGRIKTEKRLLPVQANLEKQVKSLQTELLTKEMEIRQKVRQRLSPEAVVASTGSNTSEFKAKISNERSLKSATVSPERIGHVLVTASTGREKQAINKTAKMETSAARKKAESMDRQELSSLSQKVIIEGASLRQIYETQLITEKGLRRLMAEHLRGGNVSRALKQELLERQIDFERDPLLRDKQHRLGADGAGKAVLSAMLAKAGMSEAGEAEFVGADSNKKANKTAKSKLNNSPQTVVDISLMAVITTLLILILVILFRG